MPPSTRDRIGALWARWYLSGATDERRGYWWLDDDGPRFVPVSREAVRRLDDRLREEESDGTV